MRASRWLSLAGTVSLLYAVACHVDSSPDGESDGEGEGVLFPDTRPDATFFGPIGSAPDANFFFPFIDAGLPDARVEAGLDSGADAGDGGEDARSDGGDEASMPGPIMPGTYRLTPASSTPVRTIEILTASCTWNSEAGFVVLASTSSAERMGIRFKTVPAATSFNVVDFDIDYIGNQCGVTAFNNGLLSNSKGGGTVSHQAVGIQHHFLVENVRLNSNTTLDAHIICTTYAAQ